MAEATAPTPRRRPAWLSPVAVMVCVALEMALALSGLERAILTTLLVGLAAAAVGISLWLSMGLGRESRALRAVMLVPLALAVVATVVSILEAEFRRTMVRP